MKKIEYQVRPITRYIVTRYEQDGPEDGPCSAGSSTRGEYGNADVAYEVAYALCSAESDKLGLSPGDETIRFPTHPEFGFLVPEAIRDHRISELTRGR